MKNKILVVAFRWMIYVLPAMLFFSYYPIISFGANETMNFELSVPLIWLVLFDFLVAILLVREKMLARLFKKWQIWLFPLFVTLSLIWSLNVVRGILTVGVMWLIVVAAVGVYLLRDLVKDGEFLMMFWRWFFGSALFVCAWCVVQCILDVLGVSRECSLLCAGCTSFSFGFPHPNGFAIEPQFMGNLLLAPAIVAMYMIVKGNWNNTFQGRVARARRHGARALILGRDLRKPFKVLFPVAFILVATLFLTFSRGAIYAFIVAMVFMTTFFVVRTKKWKVMTIWPIIIVAFIVTLNFQGVLAQVSPTNDTYQSGVAKVLNHLSLGIIDIRVKENEVTVPETNDVNSENVLKEDGNEAEFDGYVEESTEIRKMLTNNAISLWARDLKTMMLGVGIGGAGQAMYDAGLTASPKEIVQNEYASLLLEIGLVGVAFLLFAFVVVMRLIIKSSMAPVILTLLVAYGVTLVFFSGFANALQIYLLLAVLFAL